MKYDEVVARSFQPPQGPAKESARQPTTKMSKKLRYNMALVKEMSVGLSQPFRFDILNKLANIYGRVRATEIVQDN